MQTWSGRDSHDSRGSEASWGCQLADKMMWFKTSLLPLCAGIKAMQHSQSGDVVVLKSERSRTQMFRSRRTTTLTVSHTQFFFPILFLCVCFSRDCASLSLPLSLSLKKWVLSKQCPTEMGKQYVLPSSDSLAPPKKELLLLLFLLSCTHRNLASVFCLPLSSQAVLMHPVPLCSCHQGECVSVPKSLHVYCSLPIGRRYEAKWIIRV